MKSRSPSSLSGPNHAAPRSPGSLMRSHRQLEAEHRRQLGRLVDPHAPAVRLGGEPAEVEPEPEVHAPLPFAGLRELVEDARARLGRNGGAAVADAEAHRIAVAAPPAHGDAAARRRVAEGVVEDVLDDARDELAIGVQLDAGIDFAVDADAARAGEVAALAHQRRDQLADGDARALELQRAGLD